MRQNAIDLSVLMVATAILALSFAQREPRQVELPQPPKPVHESWELQVKYTAPPPKKSWTADFSWLDETGQAHLQIDGKDVSFQPGQSELAELRRAVLREQLADLKPFYEVRQKGDDPPHTPPLGRGPKYEGEGGDEVELSIKSPRGDGKVSLRQPLALRGNREARRGLRVFAEALRLVGCPNGEKPLDYVQTL